MINPTAIIIHYGEIALKGGNRDFFEDALVKNLRLVIGKDNGFVVNKYGKIIIDLKEKSNLDEITSKLLKVPGIVYFSPCFVVGLDTNEIINKSLEIIKNKEFSTFRVSTRRSNKKFSLSSEDFDKLLGEKILDNNPDKKVKLRNSDLELSVDISDKEAYIYTDKIKGIGGLPVGTSGTVISSLSGGIDSPVASFMSMKRGCKVVFVHIHNNSFQGSVVKEKIISLVKTLKDYQIGVNTELFIVPFDDIQKQIIISVPPKLRMIVYRRFMMKIINLVARKVKAKAVITGDSIGQVASQTLENIMCIQDSSKLPVLSPLIGMNKEEIVDISKKIGTFDTSIIQGNDCCSFMIAKSPETHGKLEEIRAVEEKIENKEKLIEDAVMKVESLKF